MDDAGGVQLGNESAEARIAAIADSQFGVFSRRQALDAGFSARQIQLRITGRRWEASRRGVYRIVGAPEHLEQRAMAAVLYAGEGALVSHATAGRLWGIDGVRGLDIELWVASRKKSDGKALTIHRGTRLDRADRTRLGALPVTTAARTLIDLSARMEDAPLLHAVEHAIRKKLVTAERLAKRAAVLRSSGRPGAGRLVELLADRGATASLESRLEAETWLLLGRIQVPRPQRQFWVSLPGGRYRLDFAWPEHRVGLECDGWEHHGPRSSFAPDRARLAEFASAGWRILPVTWHAVTREPERVERWLRSAFAVAA